MNRFKKIKTFWETDTTHRQELGGVYPIGQGGYFEIIYRHFWEVKNLKSLIKLKKTDNFLELGCGNGRWAVALAKKINNYIGVDINANGLKYAEQQCKKENINNVTFINNNILYYEWNFDYKIDVLFMSAVTQYLDVKEIEQVISNLKPYFSEKIVIIDRSSINYQKELILDSNKYFSIYRTPKNLISIYKSLGIKYIKNKKSYVFLRNVRRLKHKEGKLTKLAIATRPFSFHFFKILSKITNFITNKHMDTYEDPYSTKNYSHDFFIFKNK